MDAGSPQKGLFFLHTIHDLDTKRCVSNVSKSGTRRLLAVSGDSKAAGSAATATMPAGGEYLCAFPIFSYFFLFFPLFQNVVPRGRERKRSEALEREARVCARFFVFNRSLT